LRAICRAERRPRVLLPASLPGGAAPVAPILLLIAGEDEEINPKRREQFAKRAVEAGSALESHVYPGAATEDTFRRAEAFFARHLSH